MDRVKCSSKLELGTYFMVWSAAVFYAIYCFTIESNKYFQSYDDVYSDFGQGWAVLSRKKDIADYEWKTIKVLIEKLYPWILLSVTVSEILRKLALIKILQLWQIFIAIIFVIKELGIFSLAVILFQPLIFTLTVVTWRSKFGIWLCDGFALILISFSKHFLGKKEFLIVLNLNDKEAYITILTTFWINLRCVAYYLDFVDADEREFKLGNFLSYCLYLPTAFCGPFISYKDFKGCQEFNQNFLKRFFQLILNVFRFLFWILFAEFCLHFIYVNATAFHPEWVASLDSWSLYGYGYTMGQFFHIKYIILYGLSTSFAKFENVSVPSLPVCIGRIHLYSDMWKYFDAGLYNFLLRYIYIPCTKAAMIQNRLLSSLVCFIFVYIWHGIENYILIWTILNYIGIVVENFATSINEIYFENSKLFHKLGPKWFRRISCMTASPLLAISAISNFYFFARSDIGHVFLLRFLNGNFLANAILLGILYGCCQVSTELRPRKKKICKQKTKENKQT